MGDECMRIEWIQLKDFRNYETLTLSPHPGVNIFFGQNGSGKTNLLEAIHYCALGRSHRTNLDREVVRKGALTAHCHVALQKHGVRTDVSVKLTPEEQKKKTVYLDQKRASRLSELMGRVQCVIFSPEDLMLIKDGPAIRRRFLDMMISQLSTGYFVALQQYQKALEQRNALLRNAKFNGRVDDGMLDVFEDAMAASCETVIVMRRRYLQRAGEIAQKKYQAISQREHEIFEMKYLCCLDASDHMADQARRRWRQMRNDDIRRGTTGFGIHREDVSLTLSGRDMKVFASQGQIRTAALSMKLAQLDIFRKESDEAPILLLDDVMSELDMSRRQSLLREMDGIQTFITCTDESDLQGCEHQCRYHVMMGSDGTACVTKQFEEVEQRTDHPMEDFDF